MRLLVVLLLACAAVVITADLSQAQDDGYNLGWWSVDGGGGTSGGGAFVLSGTIGQPEAGVTLSGGVFQLTGGYWSGPQAGNTGDHSLYLPLVLR
jgi:hypothetical protein